MFLMQLGLQSHLYSSTMVISENFVVSNVSIFNKLLYVPFCILQHPSPKVIYFRYTMLSPIIVYKFSATHEVRVHCSGYWGVSIDY